MRLISLAVLALFAAPALAEDPVAPAPAAPKRYVEVSTAPLAIAPANTDSKIKCRRDLQIGSWVKGVRRCGTAKAWRDAEKAAQFETQGLRDAPGAMPGMSSG